MRKYVIWLIMASLTFMIGIAAVLVTANRPSSNISSDDSTPYSPCGEGLVSVEYQPDAPIRISVLSATCQSSHSPRLSFEVENMGLKTISSYKVFLLEIYEGRGIGDGSGTGISGVFFQQHQKNVESVGGDGLLFGPDGLPVPELKGYLLAVCSVSFTDGTKWDGAPLCK